MAKKQEKNLKTLKQEARTFHDVLAVIVAYNEDTIRTYRRLLKKRPSASIANRPFYEKSIRDTESELRKLEARRQRYEAHQGNKKIPAALRKKIAELETTLLRSEPGYDPWERATVRRLKSELAELFEQVEQLSNPPKPLTTTNTAFQAGKDYSGQSITRAYDGHVWDILKGHFEQLPRERGQRTSFRIAAPLPEKAEYLQLKERHFTRTLEALVDDAYDIVDELQGELQDAYDNMPEGLQSSFLGEARSEAAGQLEDIAGGQPDLPPCVSSLSIVHYPSLRQSSRGERANEAVAMIRAVSEAVGQYRRNEAKLKKAEVTALDECSQQLEAQADEIENVEFPGMFG